MNLSKFKPNTRIYVVYGNSHEKSAYITEYFVLDYPLLVDVDKNCVELEAICITETNFSWGNSNKKTTLNLKFFNFDGTKNTKKLDYIFFTKEDAEFFCELVVSGAVVAEKLTEYDLHYGQHMGHCFMGSYGCKYGEVDICPANPGEEVLELRENNRIREHLLPIFIEKYLGGYVSPAYGDGTYIFAYSDYNKERFDVFVDGYKCYTQIPRHDEDDY